MWDPSNEAFRVAGPGGLKGPLTLFQHAVGSMMMDIIWGEHGDPRNGPRELDSVVSEIFLGFQAAKSEPVNDFETLAIAIY